MNSAYDGSGGFQKGFGEEEAGCRENVNGARKGEKLMSCVGLRTHSLETRLPAQFNN